MIENCQKCWQIRSTVVFISKTKNHTCIQSCILFVWFDWACRVLPVRLSSHQLSNENGHCQLSNHSLCQPCCRDEGIHSATWFCHLAQNSGISGLNITKFWYYPYFDVYEFAMSEIAKLNFQWKLLICSVFSHYQHKHYMQLYHFILSCRAVAYEAAQSTYIA